MMTERFSELILDQVLSAPVLLLFIMGLLLYRLSLNQFVSRGRRGHRPAE